MLLHALEFNPSYTAADAMKAVCFTEVQCKNPVLQHRVHRQKEKILEERVPLVIALSTPRSWGSPLTEPVDANPVPTTKAIAASTGKENNTGVSEGIDASITKIKSIEEALQQSLAATVSDVSATAAKKMRQTNAEVLSRRAEKEEERLRNQRSFLAARDVVQEQHMLLPNEHFSQKCICDLIP